MANSSKPSAPTGRPFQPGQSGNPGGKSAEREELRRYVREAYGRKAIVGIEKLSRTGSSDKVRLAAFIWLAEQSIGRAVQAISGPDGEKLSLFDFSGLTVEQLTQLEAIRAALKVKP